MVGKTGSMRDFFLDSDLKDPTTTRGSSAALPWLPDDGGSGCRSASAMASRIRVYRSSGSGRKKRARCVIPDEGRGGGGVGSVIRRSFSEPELKPRSPQRRKFAAIFSGRKMQKQRSSSACKRNKRKELPSSPAPPLRQMFLDLGQRNFDTRTCELCKMTYTPGVPQDEAAHKKFCAAKQKSDASGIYFSAKDLESSAKVSRDDHGRDYILYRVMGENNPLSRQKCLRRVQEIVDAELGFGEGATSTDSGEHCYFLCLGKDSRRVVGCLVTERISAAYRILLAASPSNNFDESSDEAVVHGDEAFAAVLGVKQIWVSAQHRRCGIAKNLIDAARAHAVYAYVVPKDRVAFSQPTPSGERLARSYFGRSDFLVYR